LSQNALFAIGMFLFFGWIPIMALGWSISRIVRAFKKTVEISVDTINVHADNIESLDEDMIDEIVLNNVNRDADLFLS
jgi:hypothetical protein